MVKIVKVIYNGIKKEKVCREELIRVSRIEITV